MTSKGDQNEMEESGRLDVVAFDRAILSKTRRISSRKLPANSLVMKCDGKDIVKRSSSRRSRYLMIFDCKIIPAAAGKLGTLCQLDSRNPVMYIELPEGRLKLRGTLVFPRNKYLVLRLGNKEVLCEDVLENFIVFSESYWVGKYEENPSEKPMRIPDSVLNFKVHEAATMQSKNSDSIATTSMNRGEETNHTYTNKTENKHIINALFKSQADKIIAGRSSRNTFSTTSASCVEDLDSNKQASDIEDHQLAPEKLVKIKDENSILTDAEQAYSVENLAMKQSLSQEETDLTSIDNYNHNEADDSANITQPLTKRPRRSAASTASRKLKETSDSDADDMSKDENENSEKEELESENESGGLSDESDGYIPSE